MTDWFLIALVGGALWTASFAWGRASMAAEISRKEMMIREAARNPNWVEMVSRQSPTNERPSNTSRQRQD
jgi:hypothetical protein